MKRPYLIILSVLLLPSILVCCCNEKETEPTKADRTVIVYLEANSNLYSFACENIDSILTKASTEQIGSNNQLLIYLNGTTAARPRLLKVVPGQGAKKSFVADTISLKSYEKGNTLTAGFMKQVLTDAHEQAPAKEYGLVLWSHGQGWLPKSALTKTKSLGNHLLRSATTGKLTKWFGLDYSYHAMDIDELRSVLEEFDWEYILMDACFGASVEALYELRDCCRYWGGSPAEIMSDGFPYGSILRYLFQDDTKSGVIQACKAFMQNYLDDPYYPSGTMSAIDMSALDGLAKTTADLVDFFLPGKLQKPDFDSIQYFDNGAPAVFYDLERYFADAIGMYELDSFSKPRQDSIKAAYQAFKEQLSETVLYFAHTEYFYSCFDLDSEWTWIKINHPCCGLTSYIPRTDSGRERYKIYNDAWYQTSWVKDIGITEP